MLWFLSASDSHKNREIAKAPSVRLFFQASEHAGFLTLTGQATGEPRSQEDQEAVEAGAEDLVHRG